MKQQYRFILEPYTGRNSRYVCPECGNRERTFSRYLDMETGAHLADHVGRCNRLNKCTYHYTPKQFFTNNPGLRAKDIEYQNHRRFTSYLAQKQPEEAPVGHIPQTLFLKSVQLSKPIAEVSEANTFLAFLIETFGEATAADLTARYFIGTSKHWEGATVFWQIDGAGKIRTGKIIQYLIAPGPTFTGRICKRNRENTPAVQWAHKAAKLENFYLSQCLFGEHLLSQEPQARVGLVESEKTAIVASAYLPGFVWIACGGLDQLSAKRCKSLAGRSVTLFPDLKGLERWKQKRRELSVFCDCSISGLLERKATEAERDEGLDLADFLLRTPPLTAPDVETA